MFVRPFTDLIQKLAPGLNDISVCDEEGCYIYGIDGSKATKMILKNHRRIMSNEQSVAGNAALGKEAECCKDNYHALFEQAKDAIMVTDNGGNFVDVNTSFCTLFGYAKEELLQMNVRSLLDPTELNKNPIRFDKLAAGENTLNERKMLHRNGKVIYVEANAKSFAQNRILAIARDITERKRLEQVLQKSESNLHTILDTTDTIYVLLDADFRIVSYNPRAVDFARKELGHCFQTSPLLVDYFPADRTPSLTDYLKQALSGQQVSYEVSYAHDNNTTAWYYIRIFPVYRQGVIEGVMLVGSDITEKKLLEKKLLEAKVQEHKKIIRAVLNAQEVATNKIGQELHDNVNQILSSIRLYMSTIEEGTVPQKTVVDKVKDSIDLVISEIRQLSKAHVTPPPKFQLKEVIEDLLNSLNENTALKTKFRCNVPGTLTVEEELKLNVYRIVQEQTNNIVKYANASEATVVVKEKAALLHVCITDNGQGCDLNTKRKGVGITNIINRVKSYNGDIVVESSPGAGFRMKIKLPLST